MTWVPIFEVASKHFEEDIRALREIFGGLEGQARFREGYKFSPEAQHAMGWWFYTVYVKIGFIRKLVAYRHSVDPAANDERAVLRLVREQLKSQKSTARVKFHGQKPILARYWSWLMS